ncbi:ATP-binding protein [Palleronia sp. LCG004]|uniref:hybrid sensor histidine kinase/response regulator n=1 Tax=Palleronia sp. LCG004 TaxID=3079304 RepID=UPI0029434A90|nr:ATP-binding protein [Palleronia sp. LCG004]WOI57441.1 ATP-binding protein [Palleronia sp. LCG004]
MAGLIGLAVIALLVSDVARDMRLLDTATSDNVEWTIAQTEVEFLEFEAEILETQTGSDRSMIDLRRKFDVFYSRISTLGEAALYAPMREDPVYERALGDVRAFLDRAVPLIDGGDTALYAALPTLIEEAETLHEALRTLVTSSLDYFASESDARRTDVGITLGRLAAALAALIITLGLLVLYLTRLNAQGVERQRQIAQTSQRMNTVITASLDAVVVTDAGGHILEFNAAAESIFGHAAADVKGRSIGDVIVPEKYRGMHEAGMERMRRNGPRNVVGKGRVQLEGMRADGTIFPCELAIQSASTDTGEIFIAFLRDITARVVAEQELMEARDQALAGERAKTDFLAVMSHEIRTPLNGLLGNLSLLQDTSLDERQSGFVANMDTSGRQLMRHVSDVLDITRYDAGKLQITPAPMDLGGLVQDLVDGQSAAAARHGTQISWRWSGEPLDWIAADRDRLEHILMNLIGNAVKFTREGRIDITLEIVGTTSDGADLEIRVDDTGIGIAPDQIDRIFQDFVTGDVLYDRMAEGTGLGLGIVRRFAAAMNGKVSVESILGKGSRFTLHLPVKSVDMPEAPAEPAETRRIEVAPRRVLVVEDNPINQQVVRDMLLLDGHDVTVVSDGRTGVEAATATRYDLILMDISMPVMDGRAATRAIRAGDGASADVPIVALTANAMASERAAFLDDGMTTILSKPLSRKALDAMLSGLPEPSQDPDQTVIDLEHLADMRAAVGETFEPLLDRFESETDALLDWLGTDPPINEIRERVHKTAGSAAVFGARDFRAELVTIENAAQDGAREDLSRLPALWRNTRNALRAAL